MVVASRADFYQSASLLHPIIVGGPAIVFVFVYLRLASNKTLAPTTVFSLLVNVALGSTLSRIITQPALDLTRGIISIIVILLFEYASSWLISVTPAFSYIFKSPPLLCVFKGVIQSKAIKANRIAPSGVYQGLRSQGFARLCDVEALVLEGSGSWSVIKRLPDNDPPSDTLLKVPGYAEAFAAYEAALDRPDPQVLEEARRNVALPVGMRETGGKVSQLVAPSAGLVDGQ